MLFRSSHEDKDRGSHEDKDRGSHEDKDRGSYEDKDSKGEIAIDKDRKCVSLRDKKINP